MGYFQSHHRSSWNNGADSASLRLTELHLCESRRPARAWTSPVSPRTRKHSAFRTSAGSSVGTGAIFLEILKRANGQNRVCGIDFASKNAQRTKHVLETAGHGNAGLYQADAR